MRRIHYTNEQVYQAVVAGKKSTRKLKKLARDWRRSLSGVNAIWYGYKKFIRDGYGYDGRKSMDGLYKRIAEGLGEDYPKVDAPQTIKKDKDEKINM